MLDAYICRRACNVIWAHIRWVWRLMTCAPPGTGGGNPPSPNRQSARTQAGKSGAAPGRKPRRRALRPRRWTASRSWGSRICRTSSGGRW
eukprot:15451073-Alexandrium_andersonii.AAC.1